MSRPYGHEIPRRDETYRCGYDPNAHHFAETVAHWRTCSFAQCQQSNKNYQEFKEEWLRRFGSKAGCESLDDYPDVRARRAHA